jgi:phosphoglycerate kinase
MKLLPEIDLANRTVFVRCEFNVAMDEDATVMDYTRINASLPTLEHLRLKGCKVVICSHMGRPWGKRDPSKSLKQLLRPLSDLLKVEVNFADDCIGEARDRAVSDLHAGDVLLLENVRYYAEENSNDLGFGRELVKGIDVYVNDAFGNSHRPHASMVAAALASPEKCAGLLLAKELHELERINDPDFKPSIAIIGGAKVSGKDGKLTVIKNLLQKVDRIAVVGKIAYYFLLAQKVGVGQTLTGDTRGIDAPGAQLDDDLKACLDVLKEAHDTRRPLLLPVDSIVSVDGQDRNIVFQAEAVPAHGRAFDIGPQTLALIEEAVKQAGLVVWNGPAGYFEKENYKAGTIGIAQALQSNRGHVVIGGGDTVAAVVTTLGTDNEQIHICTGGGAMLTWLMGAKLPAVEALES